MQTQSIVQSSANVIRIINLKVGDIYKRYNDSSYDTSIFYGVVKSIDNNGEKTFIHSIEYKKSYGNMTASMYVIRGDKDVDIFPATPGEFKLEFKTVVSESEKEIEKLQKQIKEKELLILDTNKLIDGTFASVLSSPEYREMSQLEFNQKQLAAKQSSDF